jgi:hypothetical protein
MRHASNPAKDYAESTAQKISGFAGREVNGSTRYKGKP